MVPLEYQVRLQAKPPVNQQGKQTNREREGKPASGNEWDRNREKHKPKVKVRISNIFGYREVIAIADLLAMYVCMCECVRCVESACHWIIITTSPNVRGRRRWGPLPMCDWRDLTSTLVSSCLIYFMTQHISRTTDTTLIPRHTKNTCHDGTRSSRTQKLPTNTPTQSEPIEIQSDATRCSQLCPGHSYKSRKQQTTIRVHFIRKSYAIFQPGSRDPS